MFNLDRDNNLHEDNLVLKQNLNKSRKPHEKTIVTNSETNN